MLRRLKIVATLVRLAFRGVRHLRVTRRPVTVEELLGWYRARPDRPQPCTRPGYESSCSAYALDAVRRRGSVVGVVLALTYTMACSEWE